MIIGGSVGGAAFLALVTILICVLKKKRGKDDQGKENKISLFNYLAFIKKNDLSKCIK